ncbi:fungal transcriptional regulatory protein [Penicillium macrosclerotiorum]|uniref:fungal transcriptional regulatory protein n=1 Tax=Penicillium macrosclerotiorum TaxID=303699 RepID=UPI0025472524|nr:fungal transcriptional regulatory protein [Penicillium macrosclerotiorum]KAJ5679061.1 fungal transcriptional regulatory protein [Penicillium macrosclerotiorum]
MPPIDISTSTSPKPGSTATSAHDCLRTMEPKARKACNGLQKYSTIFVFTVNCRKQKMKCRIDHGVICRRSGYWRLNSFGSAGVPDVMISSFSVDIMRRVKAIEEHLGISSHPSSPQEAEIDAEVDVIQLEGLPSERQEFEHLWEATACLEHCTPSQSEQGLWQRDLIKHLFQTFHEKMPGFHFLPAQQRCLSPNPLLLAAILYCSSVRGTADVAPLAPKYFSVLCSAISQLTVPNSIIGTPPKDPANAEKWAFQTVLALILAGLLAEARVRETGVWISIAYRLILENYPSLEEQKAGDWRKLFNGVQIVDLEHASLHLSSPVIPIDPPIAPLRTSHGDQLHRLSRMMHVGLSHFTGRKLPTIWSCFTGNDSSGLGMTPVSQFGSLSPFTAVDGAVIRDWARRLDEWLVEFTKNTHDSHVDRITVFRQYVLHRLLVLSIYHPARGCNLYSKNMTPHEQYELLLSARATIKLHNDDKTIWSNWDLVMITWAALIVLQGVEGGVGEPDDITNIRVHLETLAATNEPRPNLRSILAMRLEEAMNGIHTPNLKAMQSQQEQNAAFTPSLDPGYEYPIHIFSQEILGEVLYPVWPDSSVQISDMI